VIRIERVLAPNPSVYTLEGTNTWIVGADPAIVIDPGPPIEAHMEEVLRAAGRVSHVLVTHDHEDHAEGAGAFAERCGAPLHARRVAGAELLDDGARFSAGGASLVAVHTPGHSADHVCFHLEQDAAIFTGDTVVGRGTSFIDPPDGDLAAYLATLDRLLALEPRVLYPGHGPTVLDAMGTLRDYVAHRHEREAEVLASLAAGSKTADEIVRDVYAAYPEEVYPLAARSVTAHLLKLKAEGTVRSRARGGTQTWSVVEVTACARCGRPTRGTGRFCGPCSLSVMQGADVSL
jgi:glyoxylase-like metal-dependent hydrolase (beta-lactamase superfamily II)